MSDVSAALGVRLYPDLVEPGGLAPALTQTATAHQLDVGRVTAPEQGRSRFTCAETTSDRGVVCVSLGAQARYFMIDLRVDGEVQAGATPPTCSRSRRWPPPGGPAPRSPS
ncbi:hypothetical protein [Micromonospora sp. WMMA2032]|uniref:hypothetical protein n=1 Tax=Micromonospora sp. WMMA2032 TaxID=2039870 RepID=UPI0020A3C50C|nr:hypothetical protein [Micromonospora sp. WMMA2032]